MSPIMATVLLIVYAVALGVVVLNWGESFVADVAVEERDVQFGSELSCPQGCTNNQQTYQFQEYNSNTNRNTNAAVNARAAPAQS